MSTQCLHEIEITPEMIEAGLDEFADYDSDVDCLGPVLRAAFLAMMRVGFRNLRSNTP